MSKFTPELLRSIAPNGKAAIVAPLPDLLNKYLPIYEINNPKRIAGFLANILTETGGFRVLEENLNYSAKRLTQVWPSRFKTMAAARPYARNPEALANNVYDRYGNTGHPGWGWKYRGSGFMQTTFVDNYQDVKFVTGIDVVARPELLRQPEMALIAACIYWKQHGCNEMMDGTQITNSRKKINGGTHGLAMVKKYYRKVLPLVQNINLPTVAEKKTKAVKATAGTGAAVATVVAAVNTPAVVETVEATSGWMSGVVVVLFFVAIVMFIGYKQSKKSKQRKEDVRESVRQVEGLEDLPDQQHFDFHHGPVVDTSAGSRLPAGD